MIWEQVGQIDDFRSLFRPDQRTRNEILKLVTGSAISSLRYCSDRKHCGDGIDMIKLVIVVDAYCSERQWLKFEAIDGNRRFCCPKEVVIAFCALSQTKHRMSFWLNRPRTETRARTRQRRHNQEQQLLKPNLLHLQKIADTK